MDWFKNLNAIHRQLLNCDRVMRGTIVSMA